MGIFVQTTLIVSGIMALMGAPALVVSWRLGRKKVTRGFALTAVGIGGFFGLVAASSDRLVEQCDRSGSIACWDVGYQGFLLFVGVIYLTASLIVANSLARG